MGAMGSRWSWWVWAIVWLHVVYTWAVWWFSWLPAVGEAPHSGATDPTVIKILILAGAILCFVLLVAAFFGGLALSRDSLRQNAGLWHFALCLIVLLPLTVWAWLWDDRKAVLFDGGIPVWPVEPSPCNAACRQLLSDQQLAYLEWLAILFFSVVFHTFILASVIHGWRMELVASSIRVGPAGTSERKIAAKRKSGPTTLDEAANTLLVADGGARRNRR